MRKPVIAAVLVALCVVIAVVPLATLRSADFGGSDSQAEEVVSQVDPDYKPWASSIIKLPGSEVESLLFALQAAAGSGVLFFCFGYLVARKKYAPAGKKASPDSKDTPVSPAQTKA